jgi:hypothetical protein
MLETLKSITHKSLVLLLVFFAVSSVYVVGSLEGFDFKYMLGSLSGIIPDSGSGTNHYAYGENIGWIDFSPAGVTDSALTGYAYGENIGWISLNCANDNDGCSPSYKVVNDGSGNLSGYAWSENTGWINFNPIQGSTQYNAKIDSNGNISGWAWGENVGWISFNCSNTNSCSGVNYKVTTSWRQGTPPADCSSMANCTACNSTSVCTACASGYALLQDNSGCQACSTAMTNCQTCSSYNTCLTCASGYVLKSDNSGCQNSSTQTTQRVVTIFASGSQPTQNSQSPTSPSQNSSNNSDILNYVSSQLKQIKTAQPFNNSLNPLQPQSFPPSGLQPTIPPPAQTYSPNQNQIIQILQKILQALKQLLDIANKQ